MVQLNPSISWQPQQTHQYLDQHRDEFFGCMFAELLPTLQVRAAQRAERAWCRAAGLRGGGCAGLTHAAGPVLAKNSLPNCRANSLGLGPCMQQPCQIRHDGSTSAACKSCLCQGNCASRMSCGYKDLPARVNSCRHIPGKQSAEQCTALPKSLLSLARRGKYSSQSSKTCLSQGSSPSRPGQAEDAAARARAEEAAGPGRKAGRFELGTTCCLGGWHGAFPSSLPPSHWAA